MASIEEQAQNVYQRLCHDAVTTLGNETPEVIRAVRALADKGRRDALYGKPTGDAMRESLDSRRAALVQAATGIYALIQGDV